MFSLSFVSHECLSLRTEEKENARLENKHKNGDAAIKTNATHVNPGPRQQSALDIVLAETGAQCRILVIQKDNRESSYPCRDFTEPNGDDPIVETKMKKTRDIRNA